MANLNTIVRTLIRLMYGADLPPGTHREALEHYRTATRLAPTRLIHRCGLRAPCTRCLHFGMSPCLLPGMHHH
jgi:hypothetical protein